MIRFMEKEDKPAVMQIIHKSDVFTEEEIRVAEELIDKYLTFSEQKDYLVIVAEQNEKIFGYLCYGHTDLTEGTYDLYWIATDPDVRGKGFGRALINRLEENIKKENGRMIIIETSSQPVYMKARNFYLLSGYKEAAVIPDFYKNGDNRIIYIKKI